MNFTSWLNELAAAYPQLELTRLQISEYRQAFESWTLSPEQWLELKAVARRRHPTFFPTIGELEELMREVKVQRRPTGNRAFRTWRDNEGWSWAEPLPGKTYDDSEPCSVEEGKKIFARQFLKAGGKPELLAKMQGLVAAREAVEEKRIEDEMGGDDLFKWPPES